MKNRQIRCRQIRSGVNGLLVLRNTGHRQKPSSSSIVRSTAPDNSAARHSTSASLAFLRRRRCIFYRKPGYFHSKTSAFLLIWRLKSRLFRVSTNSVQYDSYWFSSTFCLLSPLPHTCSKKKVLYWERRIKASNRKVHNHLYNIFSFLYIPFSKDLYKNQKKIVLSYFRKLTY